MGCREEEEEVELRLLSKRGRSERSGPMGSQEEHVTPPPTHTHSPGRHSATNSTHPVSVSRVTDKVEFHCDDESSVSWRSRPEGPNIHNNTAPSNNEPVDQDETKVNRQFTTFV